MKVVHINTHDSGGAAIAAYRLHRSLVDAGIDSKFLVLYNSNKYPDTETFFPFKLSFILKKIKNRFSNTGKEIQKLREKTKDVEMFSSPDTVYDLTLSPFIQQADIIHLHWVSNFLDYKIFFCSIKKPVVWTFHDENPFLGGCHYSGDVSHLPAPWIKKEEAFLNQKIISLNHFINLDIICPSNWMAEKTKDSFYKKFRIHTIHYGLDPAQFSFINLSTARQELKLSNEQIVFCAVAADLKIFRKGFDIILSLMDFICVDCNASLLLAGEMPNVQVPKNVIQLGKISDIAQLNIIYSASDALLFPSRQDNLPNVLIESVFCGTPALGFNVGGVPEIIQHGLNGLLTETISVESFKKLIKDFMSVRNSFNRDKIRKEAIEKFSIKKQLELVTKQYQECIDNSRAAS